MYFYYIYMHTYVNCCCLSIFSKYYECYVCALLCVMLDTMYLNEKVRIPIRANQKIYKGRVIAISV